MGVVRLITQRSQVQILPPLPTIRGRITNKGSGLWLVICKRRARAAGSLYPLVVLFIGRTHVTIRFAANRVRSR